MNKTAVFTIASVNYFAQVQTLLDSLKESNPEWDRYYAVADTAGEDVAAETEKKGARIIELEDLAIPDLNDMSFRYDVMEFNTAIKPFVMLRLLESYDRVVYLDPDIYVYGRMAKVEEAFDDGYDFVMIPHLNDYFEDDGKHPDEVDIMRAGTYNFGFFAAKNGGEAKRALRWWAKKLETQCINAQPAGIFVDQKWMDLLPGRHDRVRILRDNGYNVAYWNLSHRKSEKAAGKFFINGDPLCFFHFSGYDPASKENISKHQDRYEMDDIGVARDIFFDYAERVLNNGYETWRKRKYAFSCFKDGREIKPDFRIRYRTDGAFRKSLRGRNPFFCSGMFYGDGGEGQKRKCDGVNLIGYIRSEHGYGEGCRAVAEALSHTDVEWNAFDFERNNPSRKRDRQWEDRIKDSMDYNVSIFSINADQFPAAKEFLPAEAWEGYRIGVWYWELPEFPHGWFRAFELVDEIWAPTKFIQENLAKIAPVPVFYMPAGIHRRDAEKKFDRKYFGLPEGAFLFLNFFDVYSYVSRKNPYAAMKAFKKAFPPDDLEVGMVVKINNASENDGIAELERFAGEYRNIYFIAETMSRDEINGLINVCDASVSLHRSEGLGLLCAESMFYGKPVIATNWSGNTDFMTAENACMVDYRMIPVEDYCGMEEGQWWADPSIEHAAQYMGRLCSDKEYYGRIAANAKKYMRTEYTPQAGGMRMEKRLGEIWNNKDLWIERNFAGGKEAGETDHGEGGYGNDLRNANLMWDVQYYRELGTNPVKAFVKRAIRRSLAFLLLPIIDMQREYNASVVRTLNALDGTNAELNQDVTEMQAVLESHTGREDEQEKWILGIQKSIDKQETKTSDHAGRAIRASANLYNAIYQKVSGIEKTVSGRFGSDEVNFGREFIENKWELVDKFYAEPEKMICCVCESTVSTAEAEKLLSEDIYGGGRLLRYRCPCCGAVIGPNKMWDLSESELAQEYRQHYALHDEGETTDAEIEAFRSLNPQKGKRYLNYGCGAWSEAMDKLRQEGYDVWGFDPYAPCKSEHVINSFEDLDGKKYDGIFSHDLLEHLRYPVQTFRLFREILVDGGIMAHSTACYGYVYEYDRFHLVFYTGNAVATLCKKTGFAVMGRYEEVEELKCNVLYEKKGRK